jgi:cleavage and polyadenylation specificity factor subunit 2
MRPAGGMGVFEPLARPDLLITDAERVNVISSRRKDRDATLLGRPYGYFFFADI